MSLMSSLYIGVSGLNVSQNGLNATGHNLSNIETKGFVRQQTLLQTAGYIKIGESYISPLQTGLGVSTAEVSQFRDMFLDRSYRMELGRQGFYDSQYETVSEMENLLGELEGVAFQDSMKEFWTNLSELAKEPDSLVNRAALVETSVSFLERAENIFNQLSEYQLNLNQKVESYVSKINKIGQEILDLNNKICFYESNGVENANDLRDSRNNLLDELSQMVAITSRENIDGRVTVNVEGMPFVTEEACYQMGTMTVSNLRKLEMGDAAFSKDKAGLMENSEMLIPVWTSYGNTEVYNRDQLPDSADDTDIGGLKGLIFARGTKVGKYIDIPIEPKKSDFYDEHGKLKEAEYNIKMADYKNQVLEFNERIDCSAIVTTQAQFDQLIHGLVTTINDILCPNKEIETPKGTMITLADGTKKVWDKDTIKILDVEKAPIGMDGPPGTHGEELFSRKSMDRYQSPQTITLPDGTEIKGALIYNEEDETDNYSLYTVGEIKVNQKVLENKSLIPLSQNTNTGDYDIKTTEKLLAAWKTPFARLTPNTLTDNNFSDYYTHFIGELATKGEKYNTIASSQQGMVQSIDNKRQQITGVSSDEELTNLIKFQHAYNAAARYVNVIDEMLEHVVTRI